MFTLILIPDKATRELGNNVKPTSKKVKKNDFIDFLCFNKKTWKSGRKTIHHEPICPCRIEKSHPRGWNLTRDSASLIPG